MKLRAISLHQPWASRIVIGAKQNETRSFETRHRGPLVIHAAKRWTREQRELCVSDDYFRDALLPLWDGDWERMYADIIRPPYRETRIPLGALVGVVNVVSVVRTEAVVHSVSARELAFGDYSRGRFAWLTDRQHAFNARICQNGRQGFWTLDEVASNHIRRIAKVA